MASAGKLRIGLCGELRLEVDGRGRQGELPGRLGRVLLGYLALHRDRAVTRDELIAALWHENPPADPGRTLSTLLSALRRCLGPEVVQGRAQIRLVLPAGTEVDVERAIADAEAARTALDVNDLDHCVACADAASQVLERDLLPGFDAPWLEDSRRELEEHALAALELSAKAFLTAGGDNIRRAQAAAQRLVARAPYRESGYALLMDAQAARGNVAEALQTYGRLRRLMSDELGTVPSPEVREAHQKLLARADEGRSGMLALPEEIARIARRPLVGREELMARLDREFDRVAGGESRYVWLAGEPGIGKSHLAAAFAQRAFANRKALVMYGRASEQRLVPFEPFVELIKQLVANGMVDPADATPGFEELGRMVPELRRRLPPAGDARSGTPEAERYRLFQAAADLLSVPPGAGTVLIVVLEDLHWADEATIQLARHLADIGAAWQMMVVTTYRDTEITPHLEKLIAYQRRERVITEIAVPGLGEEETRGLVALRELDELSADGVERLLRMTGGNPLFLEELLSALGEATSAGGIDSERALEDLGVPDGVKEVVLRRVDRLHDDAREVLTLGAVAGDRFAPHVVRHIADGRADATLDRAVEARLLVETDDGERLGFAHALIREALYEPLGAQERARLHHQVAEALEAQRGGGLRLEPAELARHYYVARHIAGPEPAIRYAREAAARATDSLAWEDAVLALERALAAEALRDPPDPEDRCELLLALGDARRRAGQPDARDAFMDAARLASGRSPEQLARAAIGWAAPYDERAAVDDRRVGLLRQALEQVPADREDLRSRLLAALAESRLFAGRPDEARELSVEAVALAEGLGDDEVLATALTGRHLSLGSAENLDERLDVGVRLSRLTRRTGDREREVRGLHARIFDLLEHGDFDEAREAREALAALAWDLRQPQFAYFAVLWACTFAQIDGRPDHAERLALDAHAERHTLAGDGADRVLAAQLYLVRLAQGRLGEYREDTLGACARYADACVWRVAVPLAHAAAGDADTAEAELTRHLGSLAAIPRDLLWIGSNWLLAEAALTLGTPEHARPLYDVLAPYSDRFVQVGRGGNAGPLARTLGRLAALLGDREAAVAHLEKAACLSAAAKATVFEAQARADLSAITAAAGGAVP